VWDEADIAGLDIYNAPRYTITVENAEKGSAVANYPYALAGMEIEIAATNDPGYRFGQWTILDSDDNDITASVLGPGGETANPATFTMPTGNITVVPDFVQPLYVRQELNQWYVYDYSMKLGVVSSSHGPVVEPGATVTYTASVESGHLDYADFAGWTITDHSAAWDPVTQSYPNMASQLVDDPTSTTISYVVPAIDHLDIRANYPAIPRWVDFQYLVVEPDGTWTWLDTPVGTIVPTPVDNIPGYMPTTEFKRSQDALPGGPGVGPDRYYRVYYNLENLPAEYVFAAAYEYDSGRSTFEMTYHRVDYPNYIFFYIQGSEILDNGDLQRDKRIVIVLNRASVPAP
jgi:hypothetical protein